MPGEIFVAKDGACISTPDGELYIVQGKTTVRAGHPVHQAYPHLWEPLKVDFEVEAMPPPPREPAKEHEPERQAHRVTEEEDPPVVKSASPRTQGARARA